MASAIKKGKGKKKKGQTVDLNSFLGGGTANVQDGKSVVTLKAQPSWADAMDDDDDDDYLGPTQQIALPTAPRAAREEIDFSQIPDKPPYTAYVGNISYDVDEETLETFFQALNVNSVRLVREGGRMKGFGYVEFADKQSLVEALKTSGDTLLARKIRVDLATQSNGKDGEGGFGGDRDGRGGNQISGEGDADDDWRGSAAANKPTYESSSYGRPRDNGFGRDRDEQDGGGFGQRRGYDDREGGFGAPKDRYDGPSEADTASSWSRGPPRSTATTTDDRNGGFSSRKTYDEPSRRGYDDRDSGYGSRRGYDDKDSGFGGPRRGYDDRDSGYGRRDAPSGRYEERQSSSESAKERPRLQLAPRSKPADSDSTVSSTTSSASKPSVFGSAKPVDTAAKEREIEERMKKKEQDSRPFDRDSRDSRDSGSPFSSRDVRTNVERRVFHASGEVEITTPAAADTDRPTDSKPADSKPSDSKPADSKPADSKPADSKPTAAPEQVKKPSASIFGSAKPVDTAARERQIEEKLSKEREAEQLNSKDTGSDRRYDDRRYDDRRHDDRRYDDRRQDDRRYDDRRHDDRRYDDRRPGDRRLDERQHDDQRHDSQEYNRDAPSNTNVWSRGPPSSQQQQSQHSGNDSDRGAKYSQRDKKERALPTSIEQMPVYKDSETKDFSDKNKYAGLLGSDGDDDQED